MGCSGMVITFGGDASEFNKACDDALKTTGYFNPNIWIKEQHAKEGCVFCANDLKLGDEVFRKTYEEVV